jgi:hypothetical protein
VVQASILWCGAGLSFKFLCNYHFVA